MRRRFGLNGLHAALMAVVLGVLQFAPATVRADETVRIESAADAPHTLLDEGRQLEAKADWAGALTHYEKALRSYQHDTALLARYDRAKLHYSLARRYADRSFKSAVKELSPHQAYQLYDEVLSKLHTHYVQSPQYDRLVMRGTNALTVALADRTFRQHNLTFVDKSRIAQVNKELQQLAASRKPKHHREAVHLVADIARAAQTRLGLRQPAVFLEFVAAAAGGLDEYSALLTRDQFQDLLSQIEGNFVGLGVELKADEQGLYIVNVIRGSPAERAGIQTGDHLTVVDGRSTIGISTDEAADLLAGTEGSVAQVTVDSDGMAPRQLRIRRAHVEVPSLEDAAIVDANYGVAYVRLPTFQKTTSRDLESTLWDLHAKGMRHLILDLRGNPGGLLTAAVEVADKFVQQGGLVSTRGRNLGENFDYSARRVGTWRVPLIVLIDGDSASASEVFAGAIRDHHRGTIIGEKSYGKGSVQGLLPLGTAGMGLRLTTAKFYSPHGKPISRVGVSPDVEVRTVARPTAAGERVHATTSDNVLDAAIQTARRQLAAR